MGANTIIVILGASGHEYVAEIGCVPLVTSHLDKATPMTPEHAEEVIRNLRNCRAIRRDVSAYRIEVASRLQALVDLRRHLPAAVDPMLGDLVEA